jgi:ATP-dependent Clp protease, protease subunit
MKDFRYIQNLIEGDTVGKMSILDKISTKEDYSGITGEGFRAEFNYLVERGVKEITVDINSMGGAIFEGLTIFSTILDSPIPVTTRVIGISASMAGMISQAGSKRVIKDFALFHAHGPRNKDGSSMESKLSNLVTDQLKTILLAKSKLTAEQVDKLLSEETLLSASEAFDLGLFDSVEKTGNRVDLKKMKNLSEMVNCANELNATEKPQNTIVKPKKNDMIKINTLLNLGEVSEEATIEAVKALKAENEALKAKNVENETALKAQNSARAEAFIAQAEKDGKIVFEAGKEEVRKDLVKLAENSFETAERLFSVVAPAKPAAAATAQNIASVINGGKVGEEDRKNWDFEKWSKEDEKGLKRMKETDPSKFENLLNAYADAK